MSDFIENSPIEIMKPPIPVIMTYITQSFPVHLDKFTIPMFKIFAFTNTYISII